MAFEAFLNQSRIARPGTRGRRLIVTLSLIFHGALIAAAIVYSFWHIDELTPPTVTVTFLSATPPPPPPPPPKRKSAAKAKPVPNKPLAQPRPNEILQPRDKPMEKPDEDRGEEGGVEGGLEGGVAAGPSAPTPPPPPPPPRREEPITKFLPPNIAGQQLLTNPVTDPQYRVVMPAATAGMRLWAMVKICVSPQGAVSDVKVIKSMDPLVDPLLVEKIKTWRYKPVSIDGHFVTFCYNLRYEHAPR